MNLQTFLQSGLLESYALDQCTPEERQLVIRMLRRHEAVRAELRAIETALEQYAQARAVPPPAWMKGKIFDEILKVKPQHLGLRQLIRHPLSWVAAGLCLLLAGASWFALRQTTELKQNIRELQQIQQDCAERQTDAQARLDFLLHPATQRKPLQWIDPALRNSPGVAAAYRNEALKSAFLYVENLPPLGPDQDYQLWAITGPNIPPTPLPVLPAGARLIPIPFTDGVQQYALSLEPKGGSPTGAPSRVLGAG